MPDKEFDIASLPTTAGEDGCSSPFDGRDVFDVVDKEQQGYIKKDDLYRAFREGLIAAPPGTSQLSSSELTSQLDGIFALIDTNGNGAASREEFRLFWREMNARANESDSPPCAMM